MRWSPGHADRVRAQLPLALRLAGGAALLDVLSQLAPELGEPAAWCLGVSHTRALLVVADRHHLHTADGIDGHRRYPLDQVHRVEADAWGVTIEVQDRRIHLDATTAQGLATVVAHLATHLPSVTDQALDPGHDPLWSAL